MKQILSYSNQTKPNNHILSKLLIPKCYNILKMNFLNQSSLLDTVYLRLTGDVEEKVYTYLGESGNSVNPSEI